MVRHIPSRRARPWCVVKISLSVASQQMSALNWSIHGAVDCQASDICSFYSSLDAHMLLIAVDCDLFIDLPNVSTNYPQQMLSSLNYFLHHCHSICSSLCQLSNGVCLLPLRLHQFTRYLCASKKKKFFQRHLMQATYSDSCLWNKIYVEEERKIKS